MHRHWARTAACSTASALVPAQADERWETVMAGPYLPSATPGKGNPIAAGELNAEAAEGLSSA
jgi:hypothetical protein